MEKPCRRTRTTTTSSSWAAPSPGVLGDPPEARRPDARILVVEKTDKFDWKVGESTVEGLGLLPDARAQAVRPPLREQLPKQAFRFWFHNDDVGGLRDASETGPTQLARTPSFQLDRAKLDERLIAVAREEAARSGVRRRSRAGLSARAPARTRSRSRSPTARRRR
jgi:hypothetical protein